MEVDESKIESDQPSPATRRPAPKNYFSRREQYRLLTLVFTLMLVVVAMREAAKPVNWQWMWQMSSTSADLDPSDELIDTRLSRPIVNALPADVFVSPVPADAEHESKSLGTDSSSRWSGLLGLDLAPLKDDTVFRAVESPVWYGILSALNDADVDKIRSSSIGEVGFTQLFRQTDEYRGHTVTIRGTVRRAFPLTAGSNDQGIESYWQCWLQPDGSPNPIVVYSLQMPDDFPEGMSVNERVEWDGVFYKRWAYAADEGTRTAPLVLAKQPRWMKAAPAVAKAAPRMRDMWLVIIGSLVAAMALACFIYYRTRAGLRIAKPVAVIALCLSLLSANVATTHAQDATTADPPVERVHSVRQYLQLYEIGDEQLSRLGAVGQVPVEEAEIALRILQRLRRCPVPVLQSSLASMAARDRDESPRLGDLVRMRAQLNKLEIVRVPDDLRDRFATAQFYRCQCESLIDAGSSDGSQPITVLVDAIPKRWIEMADSMPLPQQVTFNGLVLARNNGKATVMAADRVAWHPQSTSDELQVDSDHVLLGRYGFDVGQLDEIKSKGPLSAFDRAAFYEMLLAMGRIPSAELASTAATVNVTDLLQDSSSHRGKLFQLTGNVRRCVRILVDDDEAKKYGISSYYELVVFLDPDAIVKVRSTVQSEGKYFSTYPVVVCVRQLPDGFPEGDDVHVACRVTGSYLKLWAYPSAFMDEGVADGEPKSLQFSPLLIGHAPTQLTQREFSDPLSGPGLAFAFATALIMLSGLVWWWSRGDRKFKRDMLSKKYDLPRDVRLDDQDFETTDESFNRNP